MMDKPAENPSSSLTQLEKVFEDYKNKLQNAEQEVGQIINRAWAKAEQIIAEGHEKSRQNAEKLKQTAQEEAARTLGEAQNNAERIVREALEKTKKDAKERTKTEIENLLQEARNTAEQQSEELLTQAEQKSKQLLEEARRQGESTAADQATTIISEARKIAAKVDEEALVHIMETSKSLGDGVQKFDNLLDQLRTQLHKELDMILADIARMKESVRKWESLHNAEIPRTEAVSPDTEEEPKLVGWLKLRIARPYEAEQVKELTKLLNKIPHVQVVGEVAHEEHTFVYLDLKKPVPLRKHLREIAMISSIADRRDCIALTLSSNPISAPR